MLFACASSHLSRSLRVLTTTFSDSGFMGLSAAFAESAIPNSQFGNAVVAFIFLV